MHPGEFDLEIDERILNTLKQVDAQRKALSEVHQKVLGSSSSFKISSCSTL